MVLEKTLESPLDCKETQPVHSKGDQSWDLLDFLELWQVLSTYDGDLRDLLWWPQERPIPMRSSFVYVTHRFLILDIFI